MTRDLMLEAVPCNGDYQPEGSFLHLQPERRKACQRTNSSANILAARETWSLGAVRGQSAAASWTGAQTRHTNNERNHGGAIAAGGFKTLDQLLDLPDLDVLLGLVGLLVLPGRHGRGGVVRVCGLGVGGVERFSCCPARGKQGKRRSEPTGGGSWAGSVLCGLGPMFGTPGQYQESSKSKRGQRDRQPAGLCEKICR